MERTETGFPVDINRLRYEERQGRRIATWIASWVARAGGPGCWERASALASGASPIDEELHHYARLVGGQLQVDSAHPEHEDLRVFGEGRRKVRVKHCYSVDGDGVSHGHYELVWSYMPEQRGSDESFLPYMSYDGANEFDPVRWAGEGHPRGPRRVA